MADEKKLFAFKLAEKKETKQAGAKWKARDGVTLSECSDPTGNGDYRLDGDWPQYNRDAGYWC